MSNDTNIITANAIEDKAHAAHKAAVKAFDAVNDGKHDVAVMIEAGQVVLAASKALTTAETGVKAAQFAAHTEERNASTQRLHDAIQAAVRVERDTLVKCGAIGIAFAKVDLEQDTPAVGVALYGPALKAPRATKGTGNGFKSAGGGFVRDLTNDAVYPSDGTPYRSQNAAYVQLRAEADGVGVGDVTPANSESANRWLVKHNYQWEPTTA